MSHAHNIQNACVILNCVHHRTYCSSNQWWDESSFPSKTKGLTESQNLKILTRANMSIHSTIWVWLVRGRGSSNHASESYVLRQPASLKPSQVKVAPGLRGRRPACVCFFFFISSAKNSNIWCQNQCLSPKARAWRNIMKEISQESIGLLSKWVLTTSAWGKNPGERNCFHS